MPAAGAAAAAVDVHGGEAWTKAKIDSLFFHWISSAEGSSTVRRLVVDQTALQQQQQQPSASAATPPSRPSSSSSSTSPPSSSSLTPVKKPALGSSSSSFVTAEDGSSSTPPTPTSRKSPSSSSAAAAALRKPQLQQQTSPLSSSPSSPSHNNNTGSSSPPSVSLPPSPPPLPALLLRNRQADIDAAFAEHSTTCSDDAEDSESGVTSEAFALMCQQLTSQQQLQPLPFCLVVPLFRRIRGLLMDWGLAQPSARLVELRRAVATEEEDNPNVLLPRNPAWMSQAHAELLHELEQGRITKPGFLEYWSREVEPFAGRTRHERLFRLIKQPSATGIVPADLFPVLKELIDTHPGLEFLDSAPEFQEKYARTVVARVFQRVNVSWSGEISLREWLRSDFCDFLDLVSREEDINLVTEYFSYEHFYVIYCKFWELDSNHDFSLTKDEFARFANHSLTRIIVDRIFAHQQRFTSGLVNRMGYEDFCYFLLCEEDKTSESSLRYWFALVDLDQDGQLSPWEIRVFYEEQLKRMSHLQPEDDMATLDDLLCQMKDLLCPTASDEDAWCITVKEFLREKQTSGVFLNQLFNLAKFLSYETRDPFAALKLQAENGDAPPPVLTDWDRFALQEYAKLAGQEEARASVSSSSSSSASATAAAITPEIVAQLVEEEEEHHHHHHHHHRHQADAGSLMSDLATSSSSATTATTAAVEEERHFPLFPIPVAMLSLPSASAHHNLLRLFQPRD